MKILKGIFNIILRDTLRYKTSDYLLRLLEIKRAQYDIVFDDYDSYYKKISSGNDPLPAKYMTIKAGVPEAVY